MSNERRAKTREKFGFDSDKEIEKLKRTKMTAEHARRRKMERRQRIEQDKLYQIMISKAIGFDILDAVLSFIEGFGDIFSGLIGLAYIYLSLVVVKSIRLTAAVFCVAAVDLLIGLFSIPGTLVDVFFCGNYINRMMIKGFVEDDAETKRRVNLIASAGFLVVFGLAWLVKTLLGNIIG
ncbi:MAG: DUF4112 domain-containing protein [Paludibacteraceae bacterium]|nr:DUF4112 domain-containing protein [Paludibacteraceae bacterium]